ncbi:MAG: type II secretion system protein [bacterium]|nr:type II secretion system protein [bacterium]
MKKNNKGFTLIELLIVLAIIGGLSSIVLVALNSARFKGADAAIKGQLVSTRAQSELLNNQNDCYAPGACTAGSSPTVVAPEDCTTGGHTVANSIFTDSKFWDQIASAISTSGGFNSCSAPAGGEAWAAVVQLKNDKLQAWCVDSKGVSKQVTVTNNQGGLDGAISAAGACL